MERASKYKLSRIPFSLRLLVRSLAALLAQDPMKHSIKSWQGSYRDVK